MNLYKQWGKGALACALALQLWASFPITGQAADSTLTLSSQEIITSGANLKRYVWNTTRSGKAVTVNANIVEVDLTNPNVTLDAMAGTKNQFTKKQNVLGMTKDTGAVAGINADFYNTQAEGVPEGPQITNSEVMATPPKIPGLYSFALTKDNKPIIDTFDFHGTVTAKDGTSFELGGINKTYYWYDDGTPSHADGLFMYTDAWGQSYRAIDGVNVPTEVLVQNGIIQKIAINGIIDMIAPADGYILRGSGKAMEFIAAHLKEGDPITATYDMQAHDPWNSYDWTQFKMMIGGNSLLVFDGQPSNFSRDITGFDGYRYRSRTAIGYSKDEKTVYLVTADNSGTSKGLTIPELQQVMIQAGVWKGMVLDGGGSTQLITRPLGEFDTKLADKPENGTMRNVVNGVGVFSTAPQGTGVKGLIVKGPNVLFINESSSYQVKAYDEYYNPLATDALPVQWTSDSALGTFKDNVFTAAKAGTAKLNAASGQGLASADVEIVGRSQLASLKINAGNSAITAGGNYKLSVTATTKNGVTRDIPANLVQWSVSGVEGTVQDGVLQVSSVSGTDSARITATYDGYSTMQTMIVGQEKVWYDLDTTGYMTTSDQYPAEVVAGVSIAGADTGNKSLQLSYDFMRGTGTKAAYARFNGADGVQIQGEPQFMTVKVLGDGSMNWFRAELLDGDGKLQRVDFTQNMNWTGWQKLSANLSGIKFPITLKSLYVTNPEQGQDERALKGKINFDDVSFVYKGQLTPLPMNKVKLTVNKRTVSLNNTTLTLEQAPVIINDNTMIPIRFVTEALGGTVKWEDATRKVTITRGDKMIELWIDDPELNVNGDRVTAEVAPRIMNNLSMVPLRLISEKLGWKVGWEPKGQVITLE